MHTTLLLLAVPVTLASPSSPTITLNNGVHLPTMLWGSGGATQENATATAPAVRDALLAGFPGIDCANHYHNQVGVAKGIELSGIDRADLFLATKIEPCGNSRITPLYQGHCYNESLAAFDQNLVQLNTDYVDITLLHSPPCVPNSTWADPQCMWPDQPDSVYPQHCNCADPEPCAMMQQQWSALEQRYKEGKTKAIGVSNFCKPCLECLAETATVVPAVNQLQFHVGMPGTDPKGLLSYSNAQGIVVQAYSPLGGDAHAALLNAPELVAIGKKHNQSTSSVCLKWVMQLGHAMATSTTKVAYMQEDVDVYRSTWLLEQEDMEVLQGLDVAPDDPVKSMCLF
jgi:diketogulonate reductase-like aldo/keto reductase